jgi:prepilin-type N-terminal cleavage/methylation domain-containing protein
MRIINNNKKGFTLISGACKVSNLKSKAFKDSVLIRTLTAVKNLDKIQPLHGFTLISGVRKGFTLIELLVVMAILAILMVITLANFRTSQAKSRDAQRKSDLNQIATAFEAYMTDHGSYPEDQNGSVKSCGCGDGTLVCQWTIENGQREFCDNNNTVYMTKIPGDPQGSIPYCYLTNGKSFQLYAQLENANDPDLLSSVVNCGAGSYNYGVASPNSRPE